MVSKEGEHMPAGKQTPTVYEWAGGREAFDRLTEVFYRDHVQRDEILGPVFANMPADHPHHVALWLVDAQVIGVDVPIGIPEAGGRAADEAARRFVGPRASSVFTTPVRRALEAPTYAEARALATELTGKSISAQSYALRHRILEIDGYAHEDE